MATTNTEVKTSELLLIKLDTGELWVVDYYACCERGLPAGGWVAYEDVTKDELLHALRKATNTLNANGQ